MGSDTRLLPQKQPRSTGIAQTQLVNRPATMGTGNMTPPVTASPAAAPSLRTQAERASGMQPRPTRAQDTRVELRDSRTRQRGTVLPGPPGSAVQSVELLPNVTKAGIVVAAPAPAAPVSRIPAFNADELLFLMHLVDMRMGQDLSDGDREIAEATQAKIQAQLEAIG